MLFSFIILQFLLCLNSFFIFFMFFNVQDLHVAVWVLLKFCVLFCSVLILSFDFLFVYNVVTSENCTVMIEIKFGTIFSRAPADNCTVSTCLMTTQKLHYSILFSFVIFQQFLWSIDLMIIKSLSECNGTRNHNHLVRKRTLNHLAQLPK